MKLKVSEKYNFPKSDNTLLNYEYFSRVVLAEPPCIVFQVTKNRKWEKI